MRPMKLASRKNLKKSLLLWAALFPQINTLRILIYFLMGDKSHSVNIKSLKIPILCFRIEQSVFHLDEHRSKTELNALLLFSAAAFTGSRRLNNAMHCHYQAGQVPGLQELAMGGENS